MRTPLKLLAIAAAVAGLAACNENRNDNVAENRGPAGLCKPFNTAAAAQANAVPGMPGAMPDPSTAVDDCLHRWGYTLAGSTDTADVVAEAVVAACAAPLMRWNQQSLGAAVSEDARGRELPSLLTGQPTNPIAEHNNFTQSRALFYVVQARAGKCQPPRVEARDDERQTNASANAAGSMNSPDR